MIDRDTSQNHLNQLPSLPKKTTTVKRKIQRDQLPNAIMRTLVRKQIKKIMLQLKLCLTKVIHLRSELLKTKERQSSTFLSQNDLISLVKICTLRNTTSLQSLLRITTQEHLSQTTALCPHRLVRTTTVAPSMSTESILKAIKIPIRAKMCNRRGTTSLMSLIILTNLSQQHQKEGKM